MIIESLRSVLPYVWTEHTPSTEDEEGEDAAEFTVGNKRYVVTFAEYFQYLDEPHYWSIEFALQSQTDARKFIHTATGTGDQFQVLSTVGAIIKEWAARTNPPAVGYTAHGRGRIAVYRRLLAAVFPNWTGKTIHVTPDQVVVYLTNPQNDQSQQHK